MLVGRLEFGQRIEVALIANALGSHVLIIVAHEKTRRHLERCFPEEIQTRSVESATDTGGPGAEVIVVGGDFPMAELNEVRAHPQLHDKPVVLFAPNKDLPATDWESLRVWPLTDEHDAAGQLVRLVCRLLAHDEPSLAESKAFAL